MGKKNDVLVESLREIARELRDENRTLPTMYSINHEGIPTTFDHIRHTTPRETAISKMIDKLCDKLEGDK